MSEKADDVLIMPAREAAEGEGARVRRVFPGPHLAHLDPFVLLDEFFVDPSAGFPDHEHRGFEALTYMLDGAFHHRDNAGNNSTISAGGAQRFSAGRSLVHAEMPGSEEVSHGMQLWINLPARLKQSEPDYQQVEPSAFPEEKTGGVCIRTICGEGAPVRSRTPLHYLDVRMEPGAAYDADIPPDWSGLIYVLEGAVTLNGRMVRTGEAAVLRKGGRVAVNTENQARFVLITGRPHGEPIRQHGPFVD